MRKALLVLLLCCLHKGYSQPVLTGGSNNPVPGDKFFIYDCSNQPLENKSPGPGGANIIWDHTDLYPRYFDTVFYFDCNGVSSCSLFPAANIYSRQHSNSNYTYYIANNDSFSYEGVIDTVTQLTQTAVGDKVIMRYPFTYNSSFTTNYMYQTPTPVDSFYYYGSATYVADAFGTLKLPWGTFNNVLRIHETVLQTDSQIINGVLGVYHLHSENYCWYAAGFHTCLLNIGLNFHQPPTSNIADTSVYYVANESIENTAVVTQVLEKQELTVYPNPASSVVKIKFANEAHEQVNIGVYDIMGRETTLICDKAFAKGTQEIQYDVSYYPSGVYLIRMQNNSGIVTKRLEIVH